MFLICSAVFLCLAAPSFAGGAVETSEAVSAGKEAPMLAALVAEGKLPPVADRLPEDPLVYEPVDGGEIGEYGGTIRLGTTRPDWSVEAGGIASWPTLVALDTDMATVLPNLAKEYSVSQDMKTFTFTLRRGLRWSDGEPFTTADIAFWHEMLRDEELVPSPHRWLMHGGSLVEVEVVDELTVRFIYAAPYPVGLALFSNHMGPGSNPGRYAYLPKHYFRDYHPSYTDRADLEKRARDAGYDDWVKFFKSRSAPTFYDFRYEIGMPTMWGYNVVDKGTGVFVMERNPYYWKVDTEGNQLPYIDRLQIANLENKEVLITKIINGELDYSRYFLDMENYPLLVDNQETGNYVVIDEWVQAFVTPNAIRFNLTHADPVLRSLFQDFGFRRAMSIAINRDEMNEVLYFGTGTPMQNTVVPRTSKYFDDRNAFSHTEYDPETANRLLDELGLKWDERNEWRLRPDGEKLVLVNHFSHPINLPAAAELLTEYWREVGINVLPKQVDGAIFATAVKNNNEFDLAMFPATAVEPRILGDPGNLVPISSNNLWGNLWYHWWISGGSKGEEPPREIKDLFDWYETASTDTDPAKREAAVRAILKSNGDNLWFIGTIGLYPQIAVINENMMNVPRSPITAVGDVRHDSIANPETWFYRGGEAAR